MEFFYSGAEPSMSAQESVGTLTSPQFTGCVFNWIPLESSICMLKHKIKERSLRILQFLTQSCEQLSGLCE